MAKHDLRQLAALGAFIGCAMAIGQVSSTPYSPYQTPKSYTDYYKQNVQTYWRPPASSGQYVVDTYFYHRPTVSPYLNLSRSTDSYTNNYYKYVRPELDRRATTGANITPSAPAPTANAGGQYYNHWYSGRSDLGLK